MIYISRKILGSVASKYTEIKRAFKHGIWYNITIMRMLRNKTKLVKMSKEDNPFVPLSASECISFIWELTDEIWSLKGSGDAKRRLQRNVTNLIRQ